MASMEDLLISSFIAKKPQFSEEAVIEGFVEEAMEHLLEAGAAAGKKTAKGAKESCPPSKPIKRGRSPKKPRELMPGTAAYAQHQAKLKREEAERLAEEKRVAEMERVESERLARLDRFRTDPVPDNHYVEVLVKASLGLTDFPEPFQSVYDEYVRGFIMKTIREITDLPEEYGLESMQDEKTFGVVYLKTMKFVEKIRKENALQQRGPICDRQERPPKRQVSGNLKVLNCFFIVPLTI